MRTPKTLLITAMLLASPAFADEPSTMEQKLQETLRGLLEQMRLTLDEALDETLGFFGAFGAIDDPRHYELPEILPNGDIVIRRREDAPAYTPSEPETPATDQDAIDL